MITLEKLKSPAKFPAILRLAWSGGKKRVPFVRQGEWSDCGAACLTMVLGYHGSEVRLGEVRDALGGGRDGADASSLLRVAETYGLRVRGLQLEIDDLRHLPPASILHWELDHFVVFEGYTPAGVELVDPARGRRLVPLGEVRRSFSGVALALEPSDTFQPLRQGANRLSVYFGQLLAERRSVARVVLTSFVLRIFALAFPILTGLIVDRVVPHGDLKLLFVVACGLAFTLLFQLLAQLIRGHMLLQLRTNLDTKMTLGFIDYLVALPYSFFQARSAGDLMMRVSSNANIREILTSNTLSGVLDGGLALVYLVLIFVLSPPLGAIVLALGGVQAILLVAASGRIRELMSSELDAQARSQSYLAEMMGGMESLKVAGAEHRAVEHWSNLFVDELNVSLARGRLTALIDALKDLVQGASPLIILSYGAVQVVDGGVSLGTMLALTALAIGFLGPIGTLVTNALQIQTLKSYVDRLDDVLRTEPEQNRETVARPPKLSGRIELDKVSFRYGPRSPFVIRDVSITVEPGKTVAIVGRSGSGKSTLANLMLGLYRPTDGTLLFDSFDLAQLDVREVRKQIGIVTQRPYVFAGSIRDNISMNDARITLNDVIEAAQRACLHDEISAMPMGYDTVVADGGSSLSGGQRQRIAIARALVHRPAVLLLDEATSALDSATEYAVSRNLDSLEATRIVIAHRLSTVVNADEILVIDRGRVTEAGTHHELMEKRGAYRELIAAQADLVTVRSDR